VAEVVVVEEAGGREVDVREWRDGECASASFKWNQHRGIHTKYLAGT